jgi:copper chaperone CopZ
MDPEDGSCDRSGDFSFESPPNFRLAVAGMMCQKNCGSTVAAALSAVSGVKKVIVSFNEKEALVWGEVSIELLIDAVECVGFDASDKCNDVISIVNKPEIKLSKSSEIIQSEIIKSTFSKSFSYEKRQFADGDRIVVDSSLELSMVEVKISGMSCTSCVRSLENHLLSVKGVQTIRVALLAEKGEIVFDPQVTNPGQIIDEISKLGYSGKVLRVRRVGECSEMFSCSRQRGRFFIITVNHVLQRTLHLSPIVHWTVSFYITTHNWSNTCHQSTDSSPRRWRCEEGHVIQRVGDVMCELCSQD